MRRLKDVKTPLANFFASGVLRLGAKLGPILWQFPPNFRFDRNRFGGFRQAVAARHGLSVVTCSPLRQAHPLETLDESPGRRAAPSCS